MDCGELGESREVGMCRHLGNKIKQTWLKVHKTSHLVIHNSLRQA